ncbi:MAG: acetylxylan esterase [Acidobacteria bacterium]|nr:acetylxylan esterase [Acidobacteriota bacterium]
MNLLRNPVLTVALIAGCVFAAAELPAPTLTKATSADKGPDPDGFIQRWLLLEPIPAIGLTDSAVQAIVKKEYFPNQFTVVPSDGDRLAVSDQQLSWHALDSRNYNVNLYHFAWERDKKTTNQLFWAVTTINCPRETPDVRLAIGSNAASVWWVNGKEVIGIYNDRQTVIDDGVSKRLTLKQGPNVVRAAIVNGGGATDFCARFLDMDDRPVTGFTISAGEVRK